MKVIKLYAWEIPLVKKIRDIRENELTVIITPALFFAQFLDFMLSF